MSPLISSFNHSFGKGTTFPKVVTNGLMLYLDAGNPQSYSGSGTTWRDLSGNGRNGTLGGGVSEKVPTFTSTITTNSGTTNTSGSLVFDGVNTSASGDIVTVSGTIGITNAITIFAIIRPEDTTPDLEEVISTTDQDTLLDDGYRFLARIWGGASASPPTNLLPANAPWGFWPNPNEFTSGIGPSGYEFAGTTVLGVNIWYCLAVTYTTTSTNLYLNGNLETSYTYTSGTKNLLVNSTGLRIASGVGGDQNYFQGRIPVYMTYNRALTISEIQQNFNAFRSRYF